MEATCDCRRALIRVVSMSPNKSWAVLNYGWDSDDYYKNWFASDNLAYGMGSGVSLGTTKQEPLEQECLTLFQQLIQYDKVYAARIVQHYYKFKEKIQNDVKNMVGSKPPLGLEYH